MRLIGRIWRFIVRFVKSYLMAVGLLVTLMSILLFVVVSKQLSSLGHMPSAALGTNEKVLLKVTVDENLTEESPDRSEMILKQLFSGRDTITLSDISLMLRRARDSKHVTGIYFDVRSLSLSSAGQEELRDQILEFKKSGKKVTCYLDGMSTGSYFLASAADEIILAPLGDVLLTGPTFQLVYLKTLLEKLGVSFNVVRAGKYKSAMEPLIADEPSAATLEMYRALESSLRDAMVSKIAASRKIDKAVVNEWFKKSIYTPNEAVSEKMVDRMAYNGDVLDDLKKRENADSIMEPLDFIAATENSDDRITELSQGVIGYIEASGTIYNEESSAAGSTAIVPDQMAKELRWALQEDDVKVVVMRISSPGGSALASDIIWNEVKKLSGKKPVVVSVADMAASGGYYIAAPASMIVAEPASIVGSIGVTSMIPNLSDFKNKYGINFYMVTNSDRAGIFNMGQQMTDADRALLASSVDHVYQQFTQKVAEGRRLPLEKVEEIAQGRVYTGAQGLELKLIDKIGGLQDAFREAKILAGFDPGKLYPVKQYESAEKNPLACLRSTSDFMDCLRQGQTSLSALVGFFQPAPARELKKIQNLHQLLQDDRIWAYWPHQLTTQSASSL